jgi:hypothetical protein
MIPVLVLGRGMRAGVLSGSFWLRIGLCLALIALFLVWWFSEKRKT